LLLAASTYLLSRASTIGQPPTGHFQACAAPEHRVEYALRENHTLFSTRS
jgi:hypothetical protein